MLEDITAKVWRILPVVEIPRNWVLGYCTKYSEIFGEIEKASMQCQFGGTDWDCTFIELGGGRDDFNMGKIVSSFHELSDRGLQSRLLRGAETCGKLWQRYKNVQEQRLFRMRLTVHGQNRKKRHSKKPRRSRGSKHSRKKSKKKKENERYKELRKARLAAKEIKEIRRSLINKITKLENKKHLSPEEYKELDRLHLTVIQICLKDTTLLDNLFANANDCDNYPCMFSKVIEDESMKSIVSIIRNDTMDDVKQEFRQSVQDCGIWWKLFKHTDKNANSKSELGKCLFQTFSTKCREPVLDRIKSLLNPATEQ
ncbi:hypothetical protein WN55_08802 [Dufourea novaeangliae]|uniref:Uncharacterized protein n=1 Tax=Dufourea novaeangliae TaxID=178035 RepID=A0A154NZU9_DUFNO|nr:hypothetical protein WN55_08802 [Dufourea novaeangliae]